jgi:hypothetical protein
LYIQRKKKKALKETLGFLDAIEIFGEQLGRISRAIRKDLHLLWIEIMTYECRTKEIGVARKQCFNTQKMTSELFWVFYTAGTAIDRPLWIL